MESRSNPSLRPASDHDDVRAERTRIVNGCIDPNIPPSHTPLVPIDALEDDEDLFLDIHAVETVASPAALPDFTSNMTPAFKLTDEEGVIAADVYFANPDAQEESNVTSFNGELDSGAISPLNGEDAMIMGHFSNNSDDSLIFQFSPPLQATNFNDIAEDAVVHSEPFSLYEFPRHDFEGVADVAFEFDEPGSDEDDDDDDLEIHYEASSPFPRAPWLSDDQDAHFKFD